MELFQMKKILIALAVGLFVLALVEFSPLPTIYKTSIDSLATVGLLTIMLVLKTEDTRRKQKKEKMK
jgi:hypothetical protein